MQENGHHNISVFLTKHLKEIMSIRNHILKGILCGVYQGKGHFQEHDRSVPGLLKGAL